jgi:hypothetical protein
MSERTAAPTPSPVPPRGGWLVRIAAGLLMVTCVAVAAGFVWKYSHTGTAATAGNGGAEPADDPVHPAAAVGGVPLFATWPKEKPELVLVLSGQTYGYLSPCGCSRPQKGGLERRYNLIESLKAKGWHVVGLELGDAAAQKGVHKQNLLKYRTTMRALAEMGYAGIGLGEYDFAEQLFELLAEYSLNNPGKPPVVLAGNLVGVQRGADGKPTRVFTREEYFPGGGKARPMVEAVEVVAAPGKPAVGVVGVVGNEIGVKIEKQDGQFAFLANPEFLPKALAALNAHPAKPELRVLLYAGGMEKAKAVATAFPQFQLVLCQSESDLPPQFPTAVNNGKTQIVEVGHKGQHVGVVGVFKAAGGGSELKYQLIPLGEEYLTPDNAEAEKANRVLQLLEEYAQEVKDRNLLAEFRKRPLQHPAQLQMPGANLTFVGSEACAKCHPNEFKQYQTTKHSHAYDALVKVARRPSNRQFDGECVVCHTVGFEYVGGYENEQKTLQLKHVGCESCHGPGSGHVGEPNNKQLLALLSPWKANPTDALPGVDVLKKMAATKPIDRGAVRLPGRQLEVVNAVANGLCMKCHDGENDPKFDFYEFMPKVYHSGMKAAAPPPAAK